MMNSNLYKPVFGFFIIFLYLATAGQAQEVPKFCAVDGMTPSASASLPESHPVINHDGAESIRTLFLSNGIEATIISSLYLEKRLIRESGGDIITLDDGRYFDVITDINDPAIANKGDGSFHPFCEDSVIETLKAITYPDLHLKLAIYLLPYPRRNIIVSSASGQEIFLSPHVLEIPKAVSAYIVTHEVGHVFQFLYLPESDTKNWATYKQLRRIDDPDKFSPVGPHAYRPKEIIAEDFRVLFGSKDAKFGGVIENPELSSPLLVPDLKPFFLSLAPVRLEPQTIVALNSYPNPFNPRTEIRVELGDDFSLGSDKLTIRVYDVTGALVRELYAGVSWSRELRVEWDGTASNGNRVASAMYFAHVRAGSEHKTVKLMMIK